MVLLSTLSGAMRATIKKVTVWCKEVDNRSGVTPAEQVAGTRYDTDCRFRMHSDHQRDEGASPALPPPSSCGIKT